MTLQAAFESCRRDPQITQRAAHRRVIREQLGDCVCGAPVAVHFTASRNHKLDCTDPRVQVSRALGLLQHALEGIRQTSPTSMARTSEGKRNPRRHR